MSRAVRRLAFAVAALVAADRFEPALLRSVEEARYEDPGKDFRFENSDLFGLGPLIAYLREHPRGRQPRVLFDFDVGIQAGRACRAGQRVAMRGRRGRGGCVLRPLLHK